MSNDSNKESQSVPEEMPASKYVGQGFQPKAEKSAIEYAKKHRKEYEKLGEQFFKDNFSLNVKATNVVGSGDGVEVFVHCDDHDIVFNASIPFDKESIHEKGSMRSHDNSDDMSNMVGTVLSGFEYRAQKRNMITFTSSLTIIKRNINILVLLKKRLIKHKIQVTKMSITIWWVTFQHLKNIESIMSLLSIKMKKILNKALNMLIMLLNTKEK